jgi:hypothetical protein
MGGAKHVHRTARPPRSLPPVGMTGYSCVVFLSRGGPPYLAQDDTAFALVGRRQGIPLRPPSPPSHAPTPGAPAARVDSAMTAR